MVLISAHEAEELSITRSGRVACGTPTVCNGVLSSTTGESGCRNGLIGAGIVTDSSCNGVGGLADALELSLCVKGVIGTDANRLEGADNFVKPFIERSRRALCARKESTLESPGACPRDHRLDGGKRLLFSCAGLESLEDLRHLSLKAVKGVVFPCHAVQMLSESHLTPGG